MTRYLLNQQFINSNQSAVFGKDIQLVVLYGLFIFAVVVLILFLSYFLSPQFRFSTEKVSSYECGFEPFGDARMSFDIHFYIIGILFLLFDLELVFLFPWVFSLVEFSDFTSVNIYSMLGFLSLLGLGFVYEWINNALVWVPTRMQ